MTDPMIGWRTVEVREGRLSRSRPARQPVPAGPHVLVSGPTGVGKSRRVLAPAAAMWAGPAIVVSSKPDLARLVAPRRPGPVRLLDLTGWARVPGADIEPIRYDPIAAISCPDDALDLAALLLRVGDVGAGGMGGSGDSATWQAMATPPLAALLWSAALAGETVGAVADTVGDLTVWEKVVDQLESDGDRSAMHAAALKVLAQQEDRVRSSVIATMLPAVSAWTRHSIRYAEGDPVRLDDLATGTLYVIAPAEGVAASAAVALLAQVVWRWRRAVEADTPLPPLLMVLDEVANSSPLPHLPTWVTEARGLGVRIVAAVQTTAQLTARWGPAWGQVLIECFPAALLMAGSPDVELLERAATYAGVREVSTRHLDTGGAVTSHASEVRPSLRAEELAASGIDHARLLLGGRDGGLVDLLDWSEIPW